MRIFKTVALAAALLALPACSTLKTASSLATTPLCERTLNDEKARWAAEALYNVPASAYRSANDRQLVPADLKAQIKPKLQQLGRYLVVVRNAHQACNTATLFQYKSAMEKLSAEVLELIPH